MPWARRAKGEIGRFEGRPWPNSHDRGIWPARYAPSLLGAQGAGVIIWGWVRRGILLATEQELCATCKPSRTTASSGWRRSSTSSGSRSCRSGRTGHRARRSRPDRAQPEARSVGRLSQGLVHRRACRDRGARRRVDDPVARRRRPPSGAWLPRQSAWAATRAGRPRPRGRAAWTRWLIAWRAAPSRSVSILRGFGGTAAGLPIR